jgi:hypothetical protein
MSVNIICFSSMVSIFMRQEINILSTILTLTPKVSVYHIEPLHKYLSNWLNNKTINDYF